MTSWPARFRRLAKDYERLPEVLAAMNFIAFRFVMLCKAAPLLETITKHALEKSP